MGSRLISAGPARGFFPGRCDKKGLASAGHWLSRVLLAMAVGIAWPEPARAVDPVPFVFRNDTGMSSSQIFIQFLGQSSTVGGTYNNIFGADQNLQANTAYSLDQLTDPTSGQARVYLNDFNGRIFVNFGPYGLQGMGPGYTPAAQTSTDPNYTTRYQYFEQTVLPQGTGTTVYTDLSYIDFTAISLSMSARYTLANGTLGGLNTNVQNFNQPTQNTQLLVNATYAQSGTNTQAPVVTSPFTTPPNPTADPNAIIPFGASTSLPNPDFARVISPQFSAAGVYHNFDAYLASLTGNNTAVHIGGTFVGTGTQPTGNTNTQGQTYDFTGTFSPITGNVTTDGITLHATALSGNGHVSWLNQANLADGVGSNATVFIPYASLNSQDGIYGNNGNYTVTINGGAPVNYVGISNDVWGSVVGDLYAGMSFGYVGSNATFTYNGSNTTIGSLASSQWWASGQSNNSTYMADGTTVLWTNTPAGQGKYFGDVQSNPLFYNGYAASLAPLTTGYGFPLQDRLGNNLLVYNTGNSLTSNTSVLLTINPDGLAALPTAIWTANGTSGLWTTAANWGNGTAVPAANASVQFVGNHTQTITVDTVGNQSVSGIAFNFAAGTFTIGNNTITLSGDVVNSSTKTQTINSGLILGSNSTVTAAFGDLALGGAIALSNPGAARTLTFSGTQNSTVSGVISDGTVAGGSVVKKGTGTLTLNGNNTFTGGLKHQIGALVLGSDQAAGTGMLTLGKAASADAVLQASGGSRTLANALAIVGNTTFSGSNGFVFNGPTTLTGGNVTQGNSTVMFQNFTVTNFVAAPVEFAGAIGESVAGSSLTKAGNGTVTLSGNAANTFTGALSVNDGTLALNKTSGVAYAGNLTIGDGVGAAASAVVSLGANGQTPGTGLTIASDGRLALNSFGASAGNLTLTGGSVTGTGTLSISNSSTIHFAGLGNATASISSPVFLNDLSPGGNGTFTFVTDNNASAVEMLISGPISGGSGAGLSSLTKAGSGTLQFTSSSTFNGKVAINQGVLATQSMGNASVSINSGALSPGGSGTIQTISVANLYATENAAQVGSFLMDLGASGSSDLVQSSAIINLRNSTTFLFNAADGFGAGGNYTLVSGAGWQAVNPSSFNMVSLGIAGLTGSFSRVGNDLIFSALAGQTATWDGGGLDGNWTNADNWSPNAVPLAGADLTFAGSSRTTISTVANQTSGAITFAPGASAFTINNNTIVLGGNLSNNSSNTQTITSGIVINADRTIAANTGNFAFGNIALSNVGALPGTLTFSGEQNTAVTGSISDGPAVGGSVVKAGNGTLSLSGNNTFNGTLTISGGVLAANSAAALGSGVGPTSGTGIQGPNSLTFAGGTLRADGNIVSGLNRSLIMQSTGVIDTNGNNVTINGTIEGAGGLTKNGTGTLFLNQANTAFVNTYLGETLINNGILQMNAGTVLGSTGGSTTVQSGGSLVIANTFNVDGEALSLSGTGAGGIGALSLLANQQSTWNGTVTLSGDASIQAGNSATLTLSQSVNVGAHTLTIGGNTSSASPTEVLSGNLSGSGGGLTKTGNGTVNLSGNNTGYTGATTVSGGVLAALGSKALGTGSSLSVGSGATLQLQSQSDMLASFTSISLSGTGVVVGIKNQGAINNNTTNNATVSGPITLAADTLINSTTGQLTLSGGITLGNYSLTTSSSSAPITLSGIISGGGGVSTSTAGGLILSGNNSYNGTTTVVGNIFNTFLTIASNNALGSTAGGTTVENNAALNLQGGITIGGESLSLQGVGIGATGALRNLSGNNSYAGSIALAAATQIGSANGTLTLSSDLNINQALTLQTDISSAAITLSGNLSGASATRVQGSGLATISGNASAYTGPITIFSGTLASGNLNSTLTIGPGTGSSAAASFSPGGIGTIETVAVGGLSLAQGGQLIMDLGASSSDTIAPVSGQGFAINNPFFFYFNNKGFTSSGNYTLIALTGAGITNPDSAGANFTFSTNIENLSGRFVANSGAPGILTFQAISGPAVWASGNGSWSNGADWDLGGSHYVPANGSSVLFSGNGTATVDTVSNRLAGSVTFAAGAGAYTLSNNTISIYSQVLNNSTVTQTISSGLALAGNVTINAQAGGLALTGPVSFGENGTRTLTFAGTNNTTVSGVISNGSATSGSLVKTGAGTLALSGNNTFTGTTTITSGTLVLSGSLAAGNAISVEANGTLAGSGTAAGLVTVAGTLSPGSSPGRLSTGSETWLDGGNYNWQIFSAAEGPGANYDTVAITGGLDLSILSAGGFAINLWSLSALPNTSGPAIGFDDTNNYAWTIASTTTGITGFSAGNFAIHTVATNGAGGFANSYGGSFSMGVSGNNLQLIYTAVPEASTWAYLAGSAIVLAFLRRRFGRAQKHKYIS